MKPVSAAARLKIDGVEVDVAFEDLADEDDMRWVGLVGAIIL